ncbi:MAG: anhydro-N-acetylmuramic acid kinase [Chitinophagaceae bacterium]|nr:anhydro-N-acetylmuramic acid kinase [Chitinophagaceae bacterium]
MVYHAIGTMSGSSMDGIDIAYCILEEIRGQWTYTMPHTECIPFPETWKNTLLKVNQLSGRELLRAHTAFGAWMGNEIAQFIDRHALHHKIHLVASHGHTVFHEPENKMTFQLGDGAAMATHLQLPVVSDLRNMDVALGGQGAPIVPMAERLLWPQMGAFLNIGGIANMALHRNETVIAFDVCPANRILNELANEAGIPFDAGGRLAKQGDCLNEVLNTLNQLPYYGQTGPKSLPNEMGLQEILPLLQNKRHGLNDRLRTMVEHISDLISKTLEQYTIHNTEILVTGGGAFNHFLIQRMNEKIAPQHNVCIIPDTETIQYKEALAMALLGILRWREENTVLTSVTGAERASVGGALWMGQV